MHRHEPHQEHHREQAARLVSESLARMQAAGERSTGSRRAVLQVLAAEEDHLSADEVAEQLKPQGIHRTTVYRTLERFTDLGITTLRQLPGEAVAYHFATPSHLHAHCRRCEAVVALPPQALDAAREEISRATGFQLDVYTSTFTGLCSACV